jgi:hypothetical protein
MELEKPGLPPKGNGESFRGVLSVEYFQFPCVLRGTSLASIYLGLAPGGLMGPGAMSGDQLQSGDICRASWEAEEASASQGLFTQTSSFYYGGR